jgi:hypothetical protein
MQRVSGKTRSGPQIKNNGNGEKREVAIIILKNNFWRLIV